MRFTFIHFIENRIAIANRRKTAFVARRVVIHHNDVNNVTLSTMLADVFIRKQVVLFTDYRRNENVIAMFVKRQLHRSYEPVAIRAISQCTVAIFVLSARLDTVIKLTGAFPNDTQGGVTENTSC